ncbi:MAG TPA: [FeFe] hydrogenase H-cluster radical SAM maturase HydG [bacterium]|jgi:2-iminoacetate synthase|nr:[FeFe] hydrogenase H-cluster radical SAM maturase HydG [bacterium]HNZ53277.1 [FeFe] hydrogenase H-cluster radical SAM maturase HydG [bacterium]HRQ71188.1 [FeFe] hydrogenase H-cluster radical SAM maturase HydG [bacterium]
MNTSFIDHGRIYDYLKNTSEPDSAELNEILDRARELKGISYAAAERLLMVEKPEHLEKIFETASFIKNEIYGCRLVLFAPLYVSNMCNNECLYCAFKRSNREITRRTLTQEEIRHEVEALVSQGHKRVLLVSGEGLGRSALDYTLQAIDTIYSTKVGKGEIRRINVNIAALEVDDFRKLKDAKIGTYQLFQETYNINTYKKMHVAGPKSDYAYHLGAMDRAMEAGIQDVGVGILFGLEDYRFEVMALLQHIAHLEERFGFGVHTISVPRLEPATGSDVSVHPPYDIDDTTFKKIIAILRITVPYTGIILSTRETAETRRNAIEMGISQISAGSRTNPGGYSDENSAEQFSLGDHRSLEEVILDIAKMGHVPSFCTGCYRLGRVGQDFMDLAKPGLIKHYCLPNAMTSFYEYLVNYAKPETKSIGRELIDRMMNDIPNSDLRERTKKALTDIEAGATDLYC